jgi:hypothetical protein
VFEWDEYYDESGHFHEDEEASNKCTAETLGVLDGKTPVEEAGMHRLFHNIFNVVKENGSAGSAPYPAPIHPHNPNSIDLPS